MLVSWDVLTQATFALRTASLLLEDIVRPAVLLWRIVGCRVPQPVLPSVTVQMLVQVCLQILSTTTLAIAPAVEQALARVSQEQAQLDQTVASATRHASMPMMRRLAQDLVLETA